MSNILSFKMFHSSAGGAGGSKSEQCCVNYAALHDVMQQHSGPDEGIGDESIMLCCKMLCSGAGAGGGEQQYVSYVVLQPLS